ncbi:MAG: IS607 family transposase [Romboutsia sp.]|uniref:IS607 family transposase n=1 Tax=Romboutsia sp. TaxID=1965302 RepID=UPI003F34DFB2
MKSKEVLQLLQITRPTLCKYVKEGIIQTTVMPNGRYDYDYDSVYKLFNKGVKRKTYIYARVSTSKQKKDLENQVELLKQFCFANGYCVNKVFSDVASGINFEKRKSFLSMLDDIISGQVERVVITYKDRLSRVGFELFLHLFNKYNCEIVVMSEVGSKKLDSEEIFEEIVALLHCYSMKLYSKRKISKIKEIISEEENSLA